MNVYKIKSVKQLTGLTKKEIKKILFEMDVITASWAVRDDKGLVVELQEVDGNFTETTILITDKGLGLLDEIATTKEWREDYV